MTPTFVRPTHARLFGDTAAIGLGFETFKFPEVGFDAKFLEFGHGLDHEIRAHFLVIAAGVAADLSELFLRGRNEEFRT